MAKVPFSKLETKSNIIIHNVNHINLKGEGITYEVKNYLPVEEKLEMISKIINQSIDDNDFYNPIRVQIFTVLEVIYAYTNLSFTPKQKENPFKLYDIIISNSIFKEILNYIDNEEWIEIQEAIIKTIENIYHYRNSVMGVLENVSHDYNGLNLDATNIQQALGDPENMAFLKDILNKLG